jgi:hypothetical protein
VLQDYENTTQSHQYYHHMHTTIGLSNSNTSLLLFTQHIQLQQKLVPNARSEALTVELLKIQAFWDVTLYHQTSISWCFKSSATTHPTTRCHNPEGLNIVAHLIRRHMGQEATNVQQQQGDSHLKHHSLISTISWLSFLALTQCPFSLTHLPWPPLGVLALHSLFLYSDPPSPHLPSSNWLRLFLSNFPYKYLNNLIPVILPTYTAYEDGRERVFWNIGI